MRFLAVFFAFLHISGVAIAAAPDPFINPVFASIQKAGAKFYYLGNRDGLDGWLIFKDKQMQIGYSTPDNKGAIVGALFGQDGENITASQIALLVQDNKEVGDLISGLQKERAAPTQAGSKTSPTSSPIVQNSPGERFLHDLSTAATVVVGHANSPEIYMIMDPRCPHCHATWKAMRDSVTKGAVHLRMVPIGNENSDDERAAAIFLGVSDPQTAWDKYVSGDASALAGTPSEGQMDAVRANHMIIDNWKIQVTPYLVYRAKDGHIKIVVGEPDKVSDILADLGG